MSAVEYNRVRNTSLADVLELPVNLLLQFLDKCEPKTRAMILNQLKD